MASGRRLKAALDKCGSVVKRCRDRINLSSGSVGARKPVKEFTMKKMLVLAAALAGLLVSASTFAADKEVSIKGEAQCAKCSLKKADKCANVIVAEENGKKVTYYIAKNEAGDKGLPHKQVCQTTKKVEAKGSVKEVDGKKELTVSSIKIVE